MMFHVLSRMLCGLMFLSAVPAIALGAYERQYYTPERLQILRENTERYPWARAQRDAILAGADKWAGYDDAKLRSWVVPPQVPRAYDIHNLGCPVHGVKANEKGLYQWGIDINRPYRIKCPAGGEEYPSNDFSALLASGFKDRSLLTGDYPDDGWGWHQPGDKTNYWFVAYYAHWSMYRFTLPAISDLGQGALVTADAAKARLYAHKCAVLLWQLAEYYPDYLYEKQSREGREHNPNYLGRWTNMIWEVLTPSTCAPAYDAIRPFLPEDTELQRLAGKSAAQLDTAIRQRLLLQAARDITDGSHRIAGNYGAHQKALLLVATVLNEKDLHPTSAEMIRYITANPRPASAEDIGLDDALVNLVYRDGIPHESIGYNYGWVDSLSQIAAELAEAGINYFDNRRFRKFITWPFDIMFAGQFVPPLGDTGDPFARGGPLSATVAARAVRHWPEPRIAHVARSNPGVGNSLFSRPLDSVLATLPQANTPSFGIHSTLFPAYGLAGLQSGSEQNRTASLMFFGNYDSHAHADQLNLLLFSQGNALLTDIGYPMQTDAFNHQRFAWYSNTVSHNTVVVDATRQGRGQGRLHAYQPAGFAQLADASCEGVYPGKLTLYRRVNMLVELSPTQSYLFDVFHVRGGRQHDYVALGAPAETSCEPALGPVQAKGTLAGPDVGYEQFYDDPALAAKPLGSIPYGSYRGSGFQYLFNVRRAALSTRAVFEWRLKKPAPGQTQYPWEGIGLRAHLLGDGDEIIAADGRPQRYAYLPETMQFMLRRRTGDNLASAFLTVYEPYRQTPFIRQVLPVRLNPHDGDTAAARIELADGTTHYVCHSLKPGRACTLDGKVRVTGQAACLVLDTQGRPQRALLFNGTELALGEFVLTSPGPRRTRIRSIDYAAGVVEIAEPVLTGRALAGQVILVAPEGLAEALTVRQVLNATHFSIGDEDLRVAAGPVCEIVGADNRLVTRVATPHVRAGMTVLNGRLQPQGRVSQLRNGLVLNRTGMPPVASQDFPAAPDGTGPRFAVVVAGPGDEVCIPSLSWMQR